MEPASGTSPCVMVIGKWEILIRLKKSPPQGGSNIVTGYSEILRCLSLKVFKIQLPQSRVSWFN